ncbi:MAG: 4Fe-4S binding protein [candidate division WOR-3 bacterium]
MGKTPKEMFSAWELREFITTLSQHIRSRLIISLGIKSVDFSLWRKFFELLNCSLVGIETIEINARHTLRELTKFYLGSEKLDEYMTPPNSESLWNNISALFIELNKLGIEYNKKVFIKLPFRSDLLILCGFINKIKEENKDIHNVENGIVGVTLINTIKSPYPAVFNLIDGEKVKMQQVSGSSLRAIRNWSIKVVKEHFKELTVWASGGIMDIEDILISQACGAVGVQLGTSIILNGIEYIDGLVRQYKKNKDKMFNYKKIFDKKMVGSEKTELKEQCAYVIKEKCIRCGSCLKLEYCDARINKYARLLKNKIIKKNGKKYFIPSKFLPRINPDYCGGCGLCMQVCKQGAIAMVIKTDKNNYEKGNVHFLWSKIKILNRVVFINPNLCNNCSNCTPMDQCKMKAIMIDDNVKKVNVNLCARCGKCIDKCLHHAISTIESFEEKILEVRHS